MALSDDELRRFRAQVDDLRAIETDEVPDDEALARRIADADADRATADVSPLERDDADPPELNFYRRARALGLLGRRG